jgi:hypothetical protein
MQEGSGQPGHIAPKEWKQGHTETGAHATRI